MNWFLKQKTTFIREILKRCPHGVGADARPGRVARRRRRRVDRQAPLVVDRVSFAVIVGFAVTKRHTPERSVLKIIIDRCRTL